MSHTLAELTWGCPSGDQKIWSAAWPLWQQKGFDRDVFPIVYGRMRSDSTSFLVYGVGLNGDCGVFCGGWYPLDLQGTYGNYLLRSLLVGIKWSSPCTWLALRASTDSKHHIALAIATISGWFKKIGLMKSVTKLCMSRDNVPHKAL